MAWHLPCATLDRDGLRMVNKTHVDCICLLIYARYHSRRSYVLPSPCGLSYRQPSLRRGLMCTLYRRLIRFGMIGKTGTQRTRTCSEEARLVGSLTLACRCPSIPQEVLLGSMYVTTLFDRDKDTNKRPTEEFSDPW